MKHEWRKAERTLYLPKATPELIRVPAFKFFVIEGEGNPNDSFFAEYIGVLYAVSYAVKMSAKKGIAPQGYFDYTVYPLEGVWDLKEYARANAMDGVLNKEALMFKLMIRQPDFVEAEFALEMLARTKKRKPHDLLERIRFETCEEGACIQMLHLGSYDNEPASFNMMEAYAEQCHYQRKEKTHREIYISDIRKVIPEKLKTVLRFKVTG